MDPKWIGIIVALAGNSLVAFSLNTQKYAHNKNHKNVNFLKLPLWWVGFVMMIFGELGNFVAYMFAPAVIVAPLGAVSVIWNGFLGKFCKFLDEEFRKRDLLGYILAIAGAVVMVFFSPKEDENITPERVITYMSNPIFLGYFSGLMVALGVTFYYSRKHGTKYSFFYLLICSILGSVTVMCVKGLGSFVRLLFYDSDPFRDWISWFFFVIFCATTVFQMKYLNMAMAHFGTSEVVPVYYVMFTVLSIVGAIVLYQEFAIVKPEHIALFFLGTFLTFFGIYLIMSKRHAASTSKFTHKDKSPVPTLLASRRSTRPISYYKTTVDDVKDSAPLLVSSARRGYGSVNSTDDSQDPTSPKISSSPARGANRNSTELVPTAQMRGGGGGGGGDGNIENEVVAEDSPNGEVHPDEQEIVYQAEGGESEFDHQLYGGIMPSSSFGVWNTHTSFLLTQFQKNLAGGETDKDLEVGGVSSSFEESIHFPTPRRKSSLAEYLGKGIQHGLVSIGDTIMKIGPAIEGLAGRSTPTFMNTGRATPVTSHPESQVDVPPSLADEL